MELPEHVLELPGKIEGMLAGGRVCFLSLTGSRAFGWAGPDMDWDIHGVFAKEGYWDHVHSGAGGVDLNLWELSHVEGDIRYQHFESFMNWSNPFYVRPGFDHAGLYSFLTPKAVAGKRLDVLQQIEAFRATGDARAALHAYRIMMVPLHWLEAGKFELNIFRLNEIHGYGFDLDSLKNAYINRQSFDRAKVEADLGRLWREYEDAISKIDPDAGPDAAAAAEWLWRTRERFFQSLNQK